MFLLSNKVSLNRIYDNPDSALKFAIYVKKCFTFKRKQGQILLGGICVEETYLNVYKHKNQTCKFVI